MAPGGTEVEEKRVFLPMLRSSLRAVSRTPLAMAGLVTVLILGFTAVAAPWLAPYDPSEFDRARVYLAPSAAHWLGTDGAGRDLFSRLLFGTRVSLAVGFVSMTIAVLIGTFLGALAGYYGGFVDGLVMRFVDVMLCFPSMFLILAVIAFVGPSIWNVMVVIGLTGWMGVCRLVRAEFLSLRERDYVAAAEALGAGPLRIIFRHLLPNALAPVLVATVLGVAGAILTESALSFLGLGVQPPVPSWGNLLADGWSSMDVAWWLSVFPGLAITVAMLAYNLFGEGLRDALDPRLTVDE
jgi:peptide/nickel transport system permease protein